LGWRYPDRLLAQQHAASRRPHFSHHESADPVPPQGTLDRFLLRTEQTGWAVLYVTKAFSLRVGEEAARHALQPRRPTAFPGGLLPLLFGKAAVQHAPADPERPADVVDGVRLIVVQDERLGPLLVVELWA